MDTSVAHTGRQFRATWANGAGDSSKTRSSRAVTIQRRSKQSRHHCGSQDEGSISSQLNAAWIYQLRWLLPKAME